MRVGKLVAGRFRVERKVADGGMGQVWRAIDEGTGAPVALKLMQTLGADAQKRFRREAEVLATLDHPGVVRYVAHGDTADGPYLAMEWVAGETLAHRLEERGLTVSETLRAIGSAAEALGEAHRRDVVHRDIKPPNLLFPEGGGETLKVIDFGIAQRQDQLGPLTQTGFQLGTPGYMAPEQIRGEEVDARADVFALGCVLYECLTGRQAFSAAQLLGARAKILFVYPDPPRALVPELPEALDALVLELLEKDPARRPADAAEVAARLAMIPAPATTTRRPLRAPPGETEPVTLFRGNAAPIRCAVAACAVEGAAPAPADLVRRARGMGAEFQAFPDGSVVAIFGPSPELRATLLAAVDFALAARFTTGVVVLASQRADGDLVGRVSQLLADAALAAAVGSPPPNSVRLDPASAQLLGDAMPTVTQDGVTYVV